MAAVYRDPRPFVAQRSRAPSHDLTSEVPEIGVDEIVALRAQEQASAQALQYVIQLHQLLLTVQEATGWTLSDLANTLAEMPKEAFDRITADARRQLFSGPLWRLMLSESRMAAGRTRTASVVSAAHTTSASPPSAIAS